MLCYQTSEWLIQYQNNSQYTAGGVRSSWTLLSYILSSAILCQSDAAKMAIESGKTYVIPFQVSSSVNYPDQPMTSPLCPIRDTPVSNWDTTGGASRVFLKAIINLGVKLWGFRVVSYANKTQWTNKLFCTLYIVISHEAFDLVLINLCEYMENKQALVALALKLNT